MFSFTGPELRDIQIMMRIENNDQNSQLLEIERTSRARMRHANKMQEASPRLQNILIAFDKLRTAGGNSWLEQAVKLADEAIEKNVDVTTLLDGYESTTSITTESGDSVITEEVVVEDISVEEKKNNTATTSGYCVVS